MPDDVDASFFGSVSYGTLLEFRKLMYTQTYFEENPLKFIDTDWVDTEALKRFLVKRESKDSESWRRLLPKKIPERAATQWLEPTLITMTVIPISMPQVATQSDRDSNYELDAEPKLEDSDTIWLDLDVSSEVSNVRQQLHRRLTVDSVEYVKGLPSYWPIPRDKCAYLVDFSDSKYEIYDEEGKLLPVDPLIKNKDQDLWTGCTDKGDSTTSFENLGSSAGEAVSNVQVSTPVNTFELNPNELENIIHAQIVSPVTSRLTWKKGLDDLFKLKFKILCHLSCSSVHCKDRRRATLQRNSSPQEICKKRIYQRQTIFCFLFWPIERIRKEHSQASIPDSVNEQHLIDLFSGRSLENFDSPQACSRVPPAHIGGKLKKCKYPHTGDGKQAKMVRHQCPTSRTIYVPLDPTIRKALVGPNQHGHSHPILPATKASKMIKEMYQKCIRAAGIVGSTVLSVENAKSTKLILGDKTSSLLAPALANSRVKEKKKAFPHGTGLEGVMHLLQEDLKKPIEERYVHGLKRLPNGGTIIVTAEPFLLSHIHKTKTLQVDTTFKRTVGELKEWDSEVVIWEEETKEALTIARIRLKRLCKDGTLLTIRADMELAQALGAGDHFLPSNEPEFSKIDATTTAEEIIEYFVRVCYIHSKRSQEEVDEFMKWIEELGIKEVSDWWQHKLNNKWVLPSLIEPLSKIAPDHWDITDSTTNLNESQHHYTNINAGIKLSLVEAILTARELDRRTAAELKEKLASGVQKSKDTYSRMKRGVARARNATKKIKETECDAALDSVNQDVKESTARLKELKAKKSQITAAKPKRRVVKAESSSSGRVTGSSKQLNAKDAVQVATRQKEGFQSKAVINEIPAFDYSNLDLPAGGFLAMLQSDWMDTSFANLPFNTSSNLFDVNFVYFFDANSM
ncbi:hypothetical protein BDZ97DRAFT_1760046 [Flammula alnicola]|nr:hypothetical protein BDZ97DRAFT_1760046 [Flammula alnicola]